jgi:uncharacterized membrane protein YhhN
VWYAIGFTLASLALLLVFERRGRSTGVYVVKPITSIGFLATAYLARCFETGYGTAVFVGLVLAFWGDLFLMSGQKRWFRLGILSFLLGHIGYAVAFAIRGVDVLWIGIAVAMMVPTAAVVLRWLWPHVTRDMKGSVIAYVVVISSMVAVAAGTFVARGNPWVLTGAVAFYLSDLSVARNRFVKESFVNRIWGLPMYYVAQLILATTTGEPWV